MRTMILVMVAALVGCGEVDNERDCDDSGPDVVIVDSGTRDVEVGWLYQVHSCYTDGNGVERCRDVTADYPVVDGVISVDLGEGTEGSLVAVAVY